MAFDSVDGTAHISLDARVTQRLEGSLLFTDVQQASDFFRHSSAGFSPARDARKLDGMELRADRWAVEPVEVLAVRSSFFEDTRLFPTGTATLDCALLMRDIPVTWTALLPMLASAALFAVSGASGAVSVSVDVAPETCAACQIATRLARQEDGSALRLTDRKMLHAALACRPSPPPRMNGPFIWL